MNLEQHAPQTKRDDLDELLELQRRSPEAADLVGVVVDTVFETIDARARELHAEANSAERSGNADLAETKRAKAEAMRAEIHGLRAKLATPAPERGAS